jgi:hypothetical protein
MNDEEISSEAKKVVDLGREINTSLRVMGATAFRIHCPKSADLHTQLGRKLSDLDFASLSKQKDHVVKLVQGAGYVMDRKMEFMMKMYGRYKFQNPETNCILDVFFDKLEMCHTIDFSKRLDLDYPTLSLADLLLEKLQIVQLTEKDVKDVSVLLLEHEVGQAAPETVDANYIARLFSDDWGFYYTATTNLQKIQTALASLNPLQAANKSIISKRVDKLIGTIENEPKSMGWKMRARIGPSKKWYREVDGTPT